jgi:hypothetical protein
MESPPYSAKELDSEDYKIEPEIVVPEVIDGGRQDELEPFTKSISKYIPSSMTTQINSAEVTLNSHPVLGFLKQRTRSPPLVSLLVGLLTFFAVFKKHPLLASYTSILYPIWWSIKGVERPRINDDERLLTFWSVNGIFHFFDYFVHHRRKAKTQIYFTLRILFNLWLQRDGSLFVYRKVIRPWLPL